MSSDNKSFGISFTDNKEYDLDEIQRTTARAATSEPLISKIVESLDVESQEKEGALTTEKTQEKLKITSDDILKYLE